MTLSTSQGAYGVDVYKFKMLFDVPDKEAQDYNVTVAGTGWTTINLSDFTDVKTLIVSVRGGAYVAETDESGLPSSFNLRLKDPASGMAQVAGAINYYVKGY